MGVSPSGLDGYLIGTGWSTPSRMFGAWTGYAAGDTPLAVSRRRTFLKVYTFHLKEIYIFIQITAHKNYVLSLK